MLKKLIILSKYFLFTFRSTLIFAIDTPKGLIIKDLEKSEANIEVAYDDRIWVHYTGWVFDKNIDTKNYCEAKGEKFDSTKEKPFRENPGVFSFTIGKGLVIPGWELGLLKMKKGSKRCLVIPHQLAYGPRSFPKIPAYSTLIFEVELIKIKKKAQIKKRNNL